jgi:hypothetical protein
MKTDTVQQAQSDQKRASRGASDVLGFFYALWSFSALGRSSYEYLLKRNVATYVPAHLSTFVGVLYIFIIVGLRRRSPRWWWITLALLVVELSGVLIVGTIDVIWHPFPYATVWSKYGIGYFFMPLVLPFAGLTYLLRKETRAAYGLGPQNPASPLEVGDRVGGEAQPGERRRPTGGAR